MNYREDIIQLSLVIYASNLQVKQTLTIEDIHLSSTFQSKMKPQVKLIRYHETKLK